MGSDRSRSRGKGDDIKRTLAATALVLVVIVVADGQSPRGGGGRYVPGEIIVKFRGSPVVRSDASDSNESEIVSRLLAGNETAGTGWRVGAVRPLVERTRRANSTGQGVQTSGSQRIAESQLRRLIRQKRQEQDRAASDSSRVYRVALSGGDERGLDAVLRAYRNTPDVEYAELNHLVSACASPNDPLLASQWAISKIQASLAWDTCVGTIEPIVAVIDSGVDLHHRDLQSNLWVNEAELHGAAGVDDDENGYIDDVNGYNFVYRTNDPLDDNGHGTHVAGIIAAAGNNGTDIAGVCWRARIMAVKALDSEGNGDTATAAAAIYYAVANGADVVNASWGGPDASQVLADAVAYAERQGVIVVAAAGNDGTETAFYPAYYSTVIAVASTEKNDRRSISSNYGAWVDIAAPGRDILSLRAAGTFEGTPRDAFTTLLSGTSMASPHVAGTCALLLAADPFLTCEQLRQIITTSGDPISTGIVSSNRRLNLAAAMRQAVSGKGVIYFDRSAYPQGSDIGILLVDSDLVGKATQAVTIQTSGGDAESVVLSQTTWAKGVFAGTISSRDAAAVPANGLLEVRDGEQVTARYADADDGLGHTGLRVSAEALADYRPAAIVSLDAGIRSSAVRLAIVTSEPTQVEVRYHRQGSAATTWVAHSDELSDHHEILLSPLPRKTDYRFIIRLTDVAGNESADANGGAEYAFSTAAESADLRVPSVYPTLQAAIDAAWIGDAIRVADGTYRGDGNTDIDFGGKALTLCSENGPAGCIIDCGGKTGGFYFHSGEDSHSVVDGFTITNAGNVDTGGGILCLASSPTIRNSVFLANKAEYYGAGICNEYGSCPAISQCTFKNNSCSPAGVDARGGGVANRFSSNPVISDCTFIGNTAGESGGAMANTDDSRPQVIRCLFQNNTAGFQGGAVADMGHSLSVFSQCVFSANSALSSGGAAYCEAGTETHLQNCLFSGNTAGRLGGAIANDGATVALTNCTLAANKGQWYCGGLWNGAGSVARIEDSILWGNTDSYSPSQIEKAQIVWDSADLAIDYSCVQETSADLPGVGNIGTDPLFADPQNGDFHLMSRAGRWDASQKLWVTDAVTSPCIDAGNPDRPLGDEPLSTPLDPTNAWSINRRIDMGIYGGTPEASLAPLN